MKNIFSLATLHVFLIIITPLLLIELIIDDFIISFLYITYFAIHFGYYIFSEEVCAEKIRKKGKILFFITTLFQLIFFGGMTILLQPGQRIEFKGLVGVFLAIIFFGSFFYSLFYVSYLYVQYIGPNKKLSRYSYVYHAGLFFFLPLGIWFLFPGLKKAYENEKLKDSSGR